MFLSVGLFTRSMSRFQSNVLPYMMFSMCVLDSLPSKKSKQGHSSVKPIWTRKPAIFSIAAARVDSDIHFTSLSLSLSASLTLSTISSAMGFDAPEKCLSTYLPRA
jgi:hypothetical protein